MNNILKGKLTSRGNLNGNVNTIVFAHNYNDLTNKPKINNVTLQGNKTASELGLATPSDITVTSVNEQTGDVILSGSDIDYSVGMSLNAKIDDLESQIQGSGVQSVNGMTGNVTLTSNDINYSTGVTIKNKIDSVEGEIPSVYVSSVNGTSGAVTLTGSDIIYSGVQSVNGAIDSLSEDLSDLTAQDIPMSETDSTPVATAVGDLSQLSTSVTSSLVGALNEVDGKTKPTTVTPTFNSSQSNYSIPFNNTRVYKIGNVVHFSSTIQADNPYGSSPGQEVYSSGMPKPYSNDNLYMSFCAWNVTSSNMRVIVTTDGKLQCRGGNNGTAYDISFSYVCQ